MEIRVLGPNDLTHMHEMLSLFGRSFEDTETYNSTRPSDEYLVELLAGSMCVAVVALSEDRVIGGLAGYFLPKFEQARSEFYIFDLAVDKDYRRQGVATGLIEKVREIAAERGAWVVYVQADPEDTPAVALYSKLGIREDVFHFDIPPMRKRTYK